MKNVHIGLVWTMEINSSAFIDKFSGDRHEHETEMSHRSAWFRNVLLFSSLF